MNRRDIKAVLASKCEALGFTSNDYEAIRKRGLIPINDKYLPLWRIIADLELIFGGRGGGKSHEVFQKKVEKCINAEYFKCYYGRKVFDTVRGSCFETLADTIEAMGLENEFNYSRANTSSMIVTHLPTGNKFIPFGLDKAYKLKSIRDPSDIVCEEFDQITFDDFKELYPTLRTLRAGNQFTGMFNTHGVDMLHWVIKVFFPELYEGEDKAEADILEGLNVLKLFVNFTDNHFIDQEDYRKKLLLAAGGNLRLYEAIANGAWGVTENDKPWLYNFDYKKHVGKTVFRPTYPIYLSFDFNNDPFGCTAWQQSPQKGLPDSFIQCIKEFTGKFKLEEMCQRIKTAFPQSIFYVTGDRSGNNEDLGRNQSLYKMIASILQIGDKNMNLNTVNLEHADSRYLCNTMFYHYPNLLIDKDNCPSLVKQCEQARIDDKSKKPHQLLKNREEYKMDEFDSMRYFFQTHYNDYITNRYLNVLNSQPKK